MKLSSKTKRAIENNFAVHQSSKNISYAYPTSVLAVYFERYSTGCWVLVVGGQATAFESYKDVYAAAIQSQLPFAPLSFGSVNDQGHAERML